MNKKLIALLTIALIAVGAAVATHETSIPISIYSGPTPEVGSASAYTYPAEIQPVDKAINENIAMGNVLAKGPYCPQVLG
jgi:hypothetical protein